MNIEANYSLDAKELSCPMPLVKTKNEMKKLQLGEVLEVQATDAGSQADIAAWSKSSGEEYLGTTEDNGILKHYIRKCSADEKAENEKSEPVILLQEFEGKYANDSTINILDVRETPEYASGHIPGSISIPLGELEERYNELTQDKEIFVICQSGNRSNFATKILADKGFSNIINVVPGMNGWTGPIDISNGDQ